MHKNQVILNVRMEAVAGRERELEGHLEALVKPTRAEPGCIVYDLHRNSEMPGVFMFCETLRARTPWTPTLPRPTFRPSPITGKRTTS